MEFHPTFNQKNYFLKPEQPEILKNYFPVSNENFPEGTPDQKLLNGHGLLFSPNVKIIKNTDNDLFYFCVTFNSLKGCQIKEINLNTNFGLIEFNFDLDYSNIDFTQFCYSEVVIDINKVDFLVNILKNKIRVNYIVTINNPLSIKGIKEHDKILFGNNNSTGGSTDPVDDFPIHG